MIKKYVVAAVIIFIVYLIYLLRDYIKWFVQSLIITIKNNKSVADLQKQGMKKRELNNEQIKEYVKYAKSSLKKIGHDINKEFILNKELKRHLLYSRFSEKYVLELFEEILKHIKFNEQNVTLKINYISSKYWIDYAGLYADINKEEKEIVLNIQNDMEIDTIISVLAHECTHYLLLSNGIEIKDRVQNEYLTDVTTVLLGFGKFMMNGYKISNRVIYEKENTRTIKKDRVGYLSYLDVKYINKNC